MAVVDEVVERPWIVRKVDSGRALCQASVNFSDEPSCVCVAGVAFAMGGRRGAQDRD